MTENELLNKYFSKILIKDFENNEFVKVFREGSNFNYNNEISPKKNEKVFIYKYDCERGRSKIYYYNSKFWLFENNNYGRGRELLNYARLNSKMKEIKNNYLKDKKEEKKTKKKLSHDENIKNFTWNI